MRALQTTGLALLLGALLLGCEEANHEVGDAPEPAADPPVVVDPVESDSADVNVDIDGDRGADVDQQREERRRPVLERLEDVDVDVDGEQTDVQIGDGEVNVDTEEGR